MKFFKNLFVFAFLCFFIFSLSPAEVMIKSQSLDKGLSKALLIPTAYGCYVIDDDKLIKLEHFPVVTKIGLPLRISGLGYAMDGLADEPSLKLSSTTLVFIVYQQNLDVNTLRLSELVFVKTKKAYQFNIENTDRQFFSNVYSRGYHDTVGIYLWRPKDDIPLNVEPVEGKTGMYRFVPQISLVNGKYAFYFKGEIHRDGTVFSSDFDRKAYAFYFEVGTNGKPEEVTPSLTEEDVKTIKLKIIKLLEKAKTETSSAYDKLLIRQSEQASKYINDAIEALEEAMEATNKIADNQLKFNVETLKSRLEQAKRKNLLVAARELQKIGKKLKTLIKNSKKTIDLS